MLCVSCAKVIPEGSEVCPLCNTEQEGKKLCPSCGEKIGNRLTICPNCGADLKRPKPQPKEEEPKEYYGGRPLIRVSDKDKLAALLLCIFLGHLGIHRFYVGKLGTGILWLLTGGIFGIGWIVDIIMIATSTFTDGNGDILT